jgi:hypothetical protein
MYLLSVRELKHGERDGDGHRVQGERHVCGGSDRYAAVNNKAFGALECFHSCSSSGNDSITAVTIVLKHAHVYLCRVMKEQPRHLKKYAGTLSLHTRLPV